ncbi:MAG: hypothetical protein IJT56_11120 [Clostridia bacterium]|nr:hypothetical protein [Clostridia bacterium]
MIKKISSALLAASFLISLAACGGEDGSPSAAGDPDTAPAETTAAETEPEIPAGDFGGTNFNVLAAVEQWHEFYDSEQTGDVVDDAVYERNMMTEEKYNVKLNYILFDGNMGGMDKVHTALAGSVMSGTGDYDMIAGGAYYITGYIAEGLYADLGRMPQVNLAGPWYDGFVNEQYELCGRQYLVSGALTVFGESESVITFFNKNIAADYNIENLYDTVKDGKWTFAKAAELGGIVTADLDGNGKLNKHDRVGIVSTWDFMSLEAGAMDYFYTEKTSDGGRRLRDINDKLLKVNDIILGLYDGNFYLEARKLGGTDAYADFANMQTFFAGGGSLFVIHKLMLAMEDTMREMENFGLLPSPKFDEAQESYITPVAAESCGVPFYVNDPVMSATVLNGLNYFSNLTVKPAYFEMALKRKSTRDDDSVEMLDIIGSTMACDFMFLFSTQIDDILYSIGDKDYSSNWAKNYDKLQSQIETIVEAVKTF